MTACAVGSDAKSLREHTVADDGAMNASTSEHHACKPTTVLVPGRNKMRITLLPPPVGENRQDPLVLVDIAKAADVVLLCMPIVADNKGKSVGVCGQVDEDATLALQVLRSMGMPQVLVATYGGGDSLKDRAASKKAAAAALAAELPTCDLKVAPCFASSHV